MTGCAIALPDDLIRDARAAWPGIEVPADEIAAFVGARLGADLIAQGARIVELYLTCACVRGDPAAVAQFQRTYFSEIDDAAGRFRAGDAVAADARQNLACTLFTGPAPAIRGFHGRGDLRGWMRVVATREVLRLVKRGKRDVMVGDERWFDAMCPAGDPEVGYLCRLFKSELSGAFQRAVAGLSDAHRALLRRQLDGITIDELAAELGIHRTSAARRLTAARAAVRESTRRELGTALGAAPADVDSLFHLISGRFDISLDELLGPR